MQPLNSSFFNSDVCWRLHFLNMKCCNFQKLLTISGHWLQIWFAMCVHAIVKKCVHSHIWICGVEGAGLGAVSTDGARESKGQLRTPQWLTSARDFSCEIKHMWGSHIVSVSMHVFWWKLPHALTPPHCDFCVWQHPWCSYRSAGRQSRQPGVVVLKQALCCCVCVFVLLNCEAWTSQLAFSATHWTSK